MSSNNEDPLYSTRNFEIIMNLVLHIYVEPIIIPKEQDEFQGLTFLTLVSIVIKARAATFDVVRITRKAILNAEFSRKG